MIHDSRRIKIDRVVNFSIVDKTSGEVLITSENNTKCPMFESCNCKTAMCRVRLPDESCYWYRYFKQLIEKNQ